MATGERRDPYRAYHFLVEIDGITRAGFRECSGLDTTQDAIEYREGNDGRTVRKLPGLVKYTNISLKRGVTDDHDLFDWAKNGIAGTVQRRNGSIIQLDETGQERIRWNFVNAWPTKWSGPSFNATSNDVAVESLDIAHEGLTRA